MPRQNQIKPPTDSIRHRGIMNQQHLAIGFRRPETPNAFPSHADNFEIMPRDKRALVRQPPPAGRRERLRKIGKGDSTLDVMISRRAENRRLDLPDK
jgi:hypothetical protein